MGLHKYMKKHREDFVQVAYTYTKQNIILLSLKMRFHKERAARGVHRILRKEANTRSLLKDFIKGSGHFM